MPLQRPMLGKQYDPLALFGDGPPAWTINRGKFGERPSSSAREATRQRNATARRLRRHAKHADLLAGVVQGHINSSAAQLERPATRRRQMTGGGSGLRRRIIAAEMVDLPVCHLPAAVKEHEIAALTLPRHENHVALFRGNQTATARAALALAGKRDACPLPKPFDRNMSKGLSR